MNREEAHLIRKQMKNIMLLFHQTHMKNLDIGEMSPSHWGIIKVLMEKGKLTIGEISKSLLVTNATISGHIDKLEKRSIVVRERSKEDRRIVYVKVDEEFAEKLKGEHKEFHERFVDIFKDTSDEDAKKIFEGLALLEEILVGGKDD